MSRPPVRPQRLATDTVDSLRTSQIVGWAYFVADLAIGIGIFRWYYAVASTHAYGIYDGFSAQAVMIGVYGRAALLAGLFVAFLRARSTVEDTTGSRFLAPEVTGRVRPAREAR